jgi:hypothetical protein
LERWGDYEYINVPIEDGVGTLTICDVSADKVNLVVAAFSDFISDGEEFGYSYDLSVVASAEGCPDPVDTGLTDTGDSGGDTLKGGCLCSTHQAPNRYNLLWLSTLIGAAFVIRRR